MRVVSLLPSATETLGAILSSGTQGRGGGGGNVSGPIAHVELIGRSHECDHPDWAHDLPVLTRPATDFVSEGAAGVDRAVSEALASGRSLYSLDEELLARLRPDLILTQNLCEVCSIDLATVRRVAGRITPAPGIVSLNPGSFEAVLDDVLTVGAATGLGPEAERVVAALRERLGRAADFVNPYADGPSVAFLEWTDPLFVGGHWTPQLIEMAGGRHPLNPTGERAALVEAGRSRFAGADGAEPTDPAPVGGFRGAGKSRRVTREELIESAPEALIVCPCGLSLAQAREEASRLLEQRWVRELPAVRAGRVAVVDGNQMFNRPGPRLVDAFEWLVGWLQDRPDVIPAGFPWERVG